MPDEQPDKMMKVLEEIRDILKERSGDYKTLLQRSEEGAQQQKEHRARLLAEQRRLRHSIILIVIAVLAWAIISNYMEFRDHPRRIEQAAPAH